MGSTGELELGVGELLSMQLIHTSFRHVLQLSFAQDPIPESEFIHRTTQVAYGHTRVCAAVVIPVSQFSYAWL